MGVMNVYDIDIEDFINAKSEDKKKLEHFNLSVMVDNEFMAAVKAKEDIFLHHPVYDNEGKILKNENEWKIKKKVSASALWDLITKKAYENGEPGVFFYDNINEDNNLNYIENVVCSNPCAEYLAGTLYGNNPVSGEKINSNDYGGACNLGSLFLHNFVVDPFLKTAKLDYKKLKGAIFTAVRFLDNIIDVNKFPDSIYENYQKNFRTIGLGVTGLADALVMLGMKYNSEGAFDFTDFLMNFISFNAYSASVELAKEKGSFPFFVADKFIQSGFLKKHKQEYGDWSELISDIQKYGIRNGKLLSVAPTGTLSLTFGNNCSSGIEPIFCLEYDRKVKINGQQAEHEKIIAMEDYAYHIWKKVPKNILAVAKDKFVTALEIPVSDHVRMLGIVAYHTDMSVSKTINVPEEYTFEQTKNIYDDCWSKGIKGCTIFRPNSLRQGILIQKDSKQKDGEKEEVVTEFPRGVIEKVPDDLNYRKYKLETGCGSLYLFLGIDEYDGKIYDCFTNTDGTGGCAMNTQANSRLLSLCLRGGVPVEKIIEQLGKTDACPSFQYQRGKGRKLCDGKSCPSAIGNILKAVMKEAEKMQHEESDASDFIEQIDLVAESHGLKRISEKDACPECGSALSNQSSCLICIQCGYSKCN